MKAVDILAIAKALSVHKSVAFRHAQKQGWIFKEMPVRGGGRRRLYPLYSLPAEVQSALAIQQTIQAANALGGAA